MIFIIFGVLLLSTPFISCPPRHGETPGEWAVRLFSNLQLKHYWLMSAIVHSGLLFLGLGVAIIVIRGKI